MAQVLVLSLYFRFLQCDTLRALLNCPKSLRWFGYWMRRDWVQQLIRSIRPDVITTDTPVRFLMA
jgi:hypothetical protein